MPAKFFHSYVHLKLSLYLPKCVFLKYFLFQIINPSSFACITKPLQMLNQIRFWHTLHVFKHQCMHLLMVYIPITPTPLDKLWKLKTGYSELINYWIVCSLLDFFWHSSKHRISINKKTLGINEVIHLTAKNKSVIFKLLVLHALIFCKNCQYCKMR